MGQDNGFCVWPEEVRVRGRSMTPRCLLQCYLWYNLLRGRREVFLELEQEWEDGIESLVWT